jgi:thiamine kinase-like enzyme
VTRAESPSSVLASIPGWQDASWQALPGGQTNETYLVEANGEKAVLKIDSAPRSVPFNTRFEESRIQKQAASVGLANDVLYIEETVYLTAHVEGRTWSPSDLAEDENLVRLAQALRRLHALPPTGRPFDAVSAARRYLDDIGDEDPVIAEQYVALIESTRRPGNLCFCHNDLVAENIIAAPDVMFLDWEYACDNDPFFDLATVVAHHELPNRQAELLLDAYFDGDGSRWRTQLVEQERLYDALHWLWAAARRGSAK